MDDAFRQLPSAAVLVVAGVLAAGRSDRVEAAALATVQPGEVEPKAPGPAPTCGPACHGAVVDPSQFEQEPEVSELGPIAPTCGPACHGGGDVPDFTREPDPQVPDSVAPTCGPACHGGEEPPPMGRSRRGCEIVDTPADAGGPASLALLGLGLGLSRRRRRARA